MTLLSKRVVDEKQVKRHCQRIKQQGLNIIPGVVDEKVGDKLLYPAKAAIRSAKATSPCSRSPGRRRHHHVVQAIKKYKSQHGGEIDSLLLEKSRTSGGIG